MPRAPEREDAVSPVSGGDRAGRTRCVKVLFPLPLDTAFDYALPPGAAPAPGTFVRAPFGPRQAVGVVWSAPFEAPGARDDADAASADAANAGAANAAARRRLKSVSEIIDAPPLTSALMDFIDWGAGYAMAPRGSVLAMTMRSGDGLAAPPTRRGYVAAPSHAAPARMTPQREAVLAAARAAGDGAPMSAGDLARAAGVSDAVVRGLARSGALRAVDVDADAPFAAPDPALPGKTLTEDQAHAAAVVADIIAQDAHKAILIDGVTGSGKTEVYLEAAAAALARDPSAQVAILLPEIALTLPFLSRVEARFGAAPAPWHSEMTGAARRRVWRRVLEGQARIVVGARSALFLPYRNLKLVIVDEEHDGAYKQEDGVVYHARDFAVARGARGGFPVVLASATPSLETVVNVDEGRYAAVGLPARASGAAMPQIDLVDMREHPADPGAWLSPVLKKAVDATLDAGEQSLLFLNRRGYAPLTLCRRCGHKMTAPNSDTMLVEHRFENRLVCHHTGFSMPKPSACPACNAVDALVPCGPGVERIAEEAASRWPDARIEVLSSDTAASPAAMRAVLDAMATGAVDILIATQVAAKGHHFPGLTLVGVVDADLGLSGGDLRAAERTYQLLSQVTGRAGRAATPGQRRGRALLQTYQPDAPVLRAMERGDRDAFLAAEAESRCAYGYPPYGRLAAVLLRSDREAALHEAARALAAAVPNGDGVEVLGPARAPIYRLRGEARMRFLVKARRDVNLQAFIKDWFAGVKTPSAVRRVVDINPYSFL